MSGVFKTVGSVASIAAMIPGPWQPIAAAVAVAANIGAALTATKPPAQGSVTDVRIGPNLPTPYAIGSRTYSGGNRMHDVGYGGTVSKVKNPYRSMVDVYSLGPVQAIVEFQADFTTVAFSGTSALGYYAGYLHLTKQLGACPEASALAGPFGAIPGWGASSKLSGKAAGLASLKFDKEGKVFSSGPPQFGAILNGVYVYDQRQDSTFPGGAGSCRPKQEATYVGGDASDNPSCHAVTYALGRYQNGKRVFGCGFETDGIDWPAWTAFANLCDVNEWKVGGVIYEPGSRWDNLKRICEAGGGEPVFVGAKLSVRYNAPKVSLTTITADDLAGGDPSIPGMRTWRDRKNILVTRYRSEEHKWEYVQADAIEVEEYILVDGEEKPDEVQFDLVQSADQATQLGAYRLTNAREIMPIELPCKPRMIHYQLGEAVTVNLPEEGLPGQLCEIIGRRVDPATAVVTLTLRTETTSKHAFALGLTGTAPPVAALTTGQDMDEVRDTNSDRAAVLATLIANSSTNPTRVLEASESGGVATITMPTHERVYPDGVTVALEAQTFGGLLTDTPYYPFYVDLGRSDTTPTVVMTTDGGAMQGVVGAHSLGRIRTPITASGITYSGGGAMLPGAPGGREVDGPIDGPIP